MTNTNSHSLTEHVEDWCLAYWEGLLSPDERSKFEKHLEQCSDCARHAEEMSHWVNLLRTNKDALCPEEWELFDYARGCEDVTGVLTSHVGRCPSCRESVKAFRRLAPDEGVPDALWNSMAPLEERPAREPAEVGHTWLSRLRERLAGFFGPPLAVAGAVAAVVLVVVFLHPFATSGPVLGLSTVTWAPDHALDLMGERGPGPKSIAPKKRLAIMLYFEDVKPKPGAQEIDALYRLLDPGRVVRRRYEVVSPSQVKEAVEREGMTQGGKQEILHLLHTKLGVQSALIMALSQRRDRFTIRASLTDTETGKVTNERKIPDVKRANLSQEVEAAAESVLKSK